MAEINKSDLFTDDALAAPAQMAAGFDQIAVSIDNVTASTKKLESSMSGGQTMSKTKQDTDQLGSSLVELDRITKQYSTSTQKLSDEWQSTKRAVDSINQSVKERLALGDLEAKQVNAQNASLKQLEAALNSNRQAYSNLTNEASRNSKQGQELLTIINSQSVSVEKLRNSMGQHRVELGNTKQELEKFTGAVGKVAPELEDAGVAVLAFGDKLISILSSPWTLLAASVAAAVAAAKASIDIFLNDTIEGSDRATQLGNAYKTAFDVIKEQAKIAGKSLVDAIFGSEEAFDKVMTFQAEKSKDVAKLMIDVFAHTPIGMAFGADSDALKKKVDDLFDSYSGKLKQNAEITRIQNELKKQEIVLIQETAELTLTKNEEMMKAREKLGQSDQERFESVKASAAAGKELRELRIADIQKQIELQRDLIKLDYPELQDAQKGIDLLTDKAAMQKVSYEQVKKLVELEAKPLEIEAEAAQGARRRQALTISIIDDTLKRQLDAQKAIREANALTHETEQQAIINDNKLRIGNDSEFSVTEQLAAVTDTLNAKKALNDTARQKELAAAKESAFQRVQLDGDTYKQIEKLAGTDVNKLVELYSEEKNKRVEANEAYLTQVDSINAKYVEKNVETERESGKQVVTVIQTNAKYFQDIREKINTEDTIEALDQLKARYDQGNVNIIAYEKQRNRLVANSKLQSLTIAKDEAKNELDTLQAQYANKVVLTTEENAALLAANKKYLAAKKAQDDEGAKIEIDREKRIYDLTIQLQNQLFASAAGIGNNIIAGEIQDSQVRVNNLEIQKQKELDIHKDSKEDTDKINKRYANLEAQETQKQLELRRKQAEYDKAIAAVEIVVRTAEAVAAALETPWEIPFIIGMGAAQEALVLSKPIPQYEFGTTSATGGLSMVGEAGIELVKSPSGKFSLTPGSPSLMNIAKGSQVFDHEQTVKMLAMASIGNERFVDGQNAMLYQQLSLLDDTTRKTGEKITKAIENADGKIMRQGSLLYRMQQDATGNQRMLRIKDLGK